MGLAWLENITDYERIWIPLSTEAFDNKLAFEAHFPRADNRLMVCRALAGWPFQTLVHDSECLNCKVNS